MPVILFLIILLASFMPAAGESLCSIQLENNSSLPDQDIVAALNKNLTKYLDTSLTLVNEENREDKKNCHVYGSFVSSASLIQLLLHRAGQDYFASSNVKGASLDELSSSITHQMAPPEVQSQICRAYPDISECAPAVGVASESLQKNGAKDEEAKPAVNYWQATFLYATSSYVKNNGEFGRNSIKEAANTTEGSGEEFGYGTGAEIGITRFFAPGWGIGVGLRLMKDNKELKLDSSQPAADSEEQKQIAIDQTIATEMLLLKLVFETELKFDFKAGFEILAGQAKNYSKYNVSDDNYEEYPNISDYYSNNSVFGLSFNLDAGPRNGIALRLLYSYMFSNETEWKNSGGSKPDDPKGTSASDSTARTAGIGFRVGF